MQEGINSNVSKHTIEDHRFWWDTFAHYKMRTSNLDINFIADSVVVITGASSGMGKEITYRYAERGCKIVIGSRNLKELTAVSN
jgi:hypothetical protein